MTHRLDLGNRTYTAEVIRSQKIPAVVEALSGLLVGSVTRLGEEERVPKGVEIVHGFVASATPFHRASRTVDNGDAKPFEVPRTRTFRGQTQFLYDALIISNRSHAVLAVPFHGLAAEFFVRADRALGGLRGLYEMLNITQMVIGLEPRGRAEDEGPTTIGVTRCQLAYTDPEHRTTSLQQVRLVGSDLRASPIYNGLVKPVRRSEPGRLQVTPVILGFGLFEHGVKRISAVTDRHGNFKVWIGTTVDRTARLLTLLDEVSEMSGVRTSTTNLPILQSRSIQHEEGG
jgi:hypothetical protein